jgi:hypothetical protein
METTEHRICDDATLACAWRAFFRNARIRYALIDSLVRSRMIEVGDVLADDSVELSFAYDEEMIQAFSAYTADEAFTNRRYANNKNE